MNRHGGLHRLFLNPADKSAVRAIAVNSCSHFRGKSESFFTPKQSD
jgi:hypothetical protein